MRCLNPTRWFKRRPHVHVFDGADGWRLRIVAANGEIMLGSEAYASRANAIRAADNLCATFDLECRIDPLITMEA